MRLLRFTRNDILNNAFVLVDRKRGPLG